MHSCRTKGQALSAIGKSACQVSLEAEIVARQDERDCPYSEQLVSACVESHIALHIQSTPNALMFSAPTVLESKMWEHIDGGGVSASAIIF